jgi:light-regulated signal transduction histidine kinase (bacteriophytochrome)
MHKKDLEEKVIERTGQLETVNKELEAFSYSISHDLRTPLRGIIGFTAMLEEDYGNKLDDEAKRITSIIKNNTLKMGLLIDGLLSFSRMERQDVAKMKINTTAMVNEVIDFLQQQDNSKNVKWVIQDLPEIKGGC